MIQEFNEQYVKVLYSVSNTIALSTVVGLAS